MYTNDQCIASQLQMHSPFPFSAILPTDSVNTGPLPAGTMFGFVSKRYGGNLFMSQQKKTTLCASLFRCLVILCVASKGWYARSFQPPGRIFLHTSFCKDPHRFLHQQQRHAPGAPTNSSLRSDAALRGRALGQVLTVSLVHDASLLEVDVAFCVCWFYVDWCSFTLLYYLTTCTSS